MPRLEGSGSGSRDPVIPPEPPDPGTRAAARELRKAGIGWNRDRHRSCLEGLVAELEKQEDRAHAEAESTDAFTQTEPAEAATSRIAAGLPRISSGASSGADVNASERASSPLWSKGIVGSSAVVHGSHPSESSPTVGS